MGELKGLTDHLLDELECPGSLGVVTDGVSLAEPSSAARRIGGAHAHLLHHHDVVTVSPSDLQAAEDVLLRALILVKIGR